jgi:Fe-S cluster assembly protein SufD
MSKPSETSVNPTAGSATTLLADFPAFVAARTDELALGDLRRTAATRFAALGLPGREREDWKYADLRPFAAAAWRGLAPAPSAAALAAARQLVDALPVIASHRFVLVDGRYRPELSAPGELPPGLSVTPLAAVSPKRLLAAGLGQLAAAPDAAFTALNTAWWQDGLFIEIAPAAAPPLPIELIHVASGGAAGVMLAPRLLVCGGDGSRTTLIERYASAGGAAHFTNAIGEVFVGDDAQLEHLKLLRENAAAWHIGASHVRQGARSRYASRELVLGGAMARREVQLVFAGAGAECSLEALYLADGDERRDLRTRVRHAEGQCRTHELYKGILGGRARGIFDGLIYVAQDAQKTDARQTNRNLLLSPEATAYSMPRLEIYADDVKCTHGSTTGQISDEQLFYLRTRGFSAEAARALLTYAFASELLETIEPLALRQELTAALLARLPQSDLIEVAP